MIETTSLPERFRTRFTNGRHDIIADAPVDKGGGGAGPGAHELLEAALAVCMNMAVRMNAAEYGIPLESVSTRVKLNRPISEMINFEYTVDLNGPLSDDQRRQLEHAARTCPVRQTLLKRIEFTKVD